MFSKRYVAHALVSLVVLCLAIAVLLWLGVLHTRRTASRFLSDFAESKWAEAALPLRGT